MQHPVVHYAQTKIPPFGGISAFYIVTAQAAGFDATTTIKRSDFGVGAYAPNVSDEVNIRITTEATGEKPAA